MVRTITQIYTEKIQNNLPNTFDVKKIKKFFI